MRLFVFAVVPDPVPAPASHRGVLTPWCAHIMAHFARTISHRTAVQFSRFNSPSLYGHLKGQNISSGRKKVRIFFVEHKKALTIRTFQGRKARQIRRDFTFLFIMLRKAVYFTTKCPHSLTATRTCKKRYIDFVFSKHSCADYPSGEKIPPHFFTADFEAETDNKNRELFVIHSYRDMTETVSCFSTATCQARNRHTFVRS